MLVTPNYQNINSMTFPGLLIQTMWTIQTIHGCHPPGNWQSASSRPGKVVIPFFRNTCSQQFPKASMETFGDNYLIQLILEHGHKNDVYMCVQAMISDAKDCYEAYGWNFALQALYHTSLTIRCCITARTPRNSSDTMCTSNMLPQPPVMVYNSVKYTIFRSITN